MARVLLMQRSIIPHHERRKYLERLLGKKAHYEGASCRFWVFEEADLPGAFLEFMEGPDARTLATAHDSSPERLIDAQRMYREVELV
ncbi:MAG: hypothetical protein ACRENI_10570 [Gemmatimonadaceae bacterium]